MVRGFPKGVKPRGDARRSRSNDIAEKKPAMGRLSGRGMFDRQCRTHVAEKPWIGCPAGQEIRARRGEAQHAIGTAAHHIGIRFILSIVLPPAHGAQFEDSRCSECPASTAQAAHMSSSHTVSSQSADGAGWQSNFCAAFRSAFQKQRTTAQNRAHRSNRIVTIRRRSPRGVAECAVKLM